MKFQDSINESFKRVRLKYNGTRKNYKINDKTPHVLVIDEKYNVDNRGHSILGINLNYYKKDVKELIDKINKFDNENGFRGFDLKVRVTRGLTKDKTSFDDKVGVRRKKRYQLLIQKFPEISSLIRRYKISGISSKKRVINK